jgi:hypothetical protein
MSRACSVVLGILCLITAAGCSSAPGPTGALASASAAPSEPPVPSDPAGQSESSSVVVDQLAGPWRSSPLVVDDAHVAIVSDACAAEARTSLGPDEADLPTALVDARGQRFVTVIMADDLTAIECLATLSEDGASATADLVVRLSAVAVAPVDKGTMSVASVTQGDEVGGDRTVAFGRIGPDAEGAKAGFGDASTVLASSAEGWWAMWWPGSAPADSYSAVDNQGLVIASAKPPAGGVEARVGPATWWIDPEAARPTASSTTIHAKILEQACASGDSPKGRVEPPRIELTDTTVAVTYSVRHKVGGQDCQGNAPFAVELKLPEPLGNRTLLDGSETPPRDATTVPSN